jgi:hypothetical protein
MSATGVYGGTGGTGGVTTYFVWGGSGYGVFLGNFSCTFCKEFGSDSINNEFGTYGRRRSRLENTAPLIVTYMMLHAAPYPPVTRRVRAGVFALTDEPVAWCDMMIEEAELGFCPTCKCWWQRQRQSGSLRRFCPSCKRTLQDKHLPGVFEEIRPGVFAQWSDTREARDSRSTFRRRSGDV